MFAGNYWNIQLNPAAGLYKNRSYSARSLCKDSYNFYRIETGWCFYQDRYLYLIYNYMPSES